MSRSCCVKEKAVGGMNDTIIDDKLLNLLELQECGRNRAQYKQEVLKIETTHQR